MIPFILSMRRIIGFVIGYLLNRGKPPTKGKTMKKIITTIAVVILVGCGPAPSTESAYLGDYSLTLPKETITLKLGSDDSFSLAGLGRENIVGAWKEKGDLLVCEGSTKQDSDRITLKFDKQTFKLISLAKNGREAPLSEWTRGTGEIYLRQNTGSPKANRALLDAAIEGKIEIVKQSLEAGANIDVQNVRGSESWTPLFGAVAYSHKEIAELLITEGADVNRKCEDFMTPLHVLVDGGQKEMIELLISNGADVNARDMRGRTPLDSAEGVIAELLRKNGGKTGEELGGNRK
jgi:hypothetical protein